MVAKTLFYFSYTQWLKWPGQAGAQGMEVSMGWGIWHILCIKEHFFINSRGLKPGPLSLTTAYKQQFRDNSQCAAP